MRRDLSVADAGAPLVSENRVEPVAQVLRGYSIVAAAGVQVLSGLRADTSIPMEATALVCACHLVLPPKARQSQEASPVLQSIPLVSRTRLA